MLKNIFFLFQGCTEIMDIFTIPDNVDMDIIEKNLIETDKIHNDYKFQACTDRNIILVGRTRTGKSTLVDVLGNVFNTTTESGYYTETELSRYERFTSPTLDGKTRLFLTVVDTPGFFEISPSGKHQAQINNNETVRSIIDSCISHDVTNVHVFALLIGGSEINREDIRTMIYVQQHYNYLGPHAALIVTHCEEMSEAQQQKFITKFFQVDELVRWNVQRAFFGKGVFFMGAIQHECYKNKDGCALERQYEAVAKMRIKLIEMIIVSAEPFNIHKSKNGQCHIL
jgi:GTP-binding protein EngB required for normal cell division